MLVPLKEEDMANFQIGDKVQVPSGTQEVPVFWIGRTGTVQSLIETPPPGAKVPFKEKIQGYGVQFDGEEHWTGIPESCLQKA
jgi:hypothetical protein